MMKYINQRLCSNPVCVIFLYILCLSALFLRRLLAFMPALCHNKDIFSAAFRINQEVSHHA